MRYFDASALVKRYFREPGTDSVRGLLRAGHVATSRLSEAEISSALARRCREGGLTEVQRDATLASLREDLGRIQVVELVPSVVAAVHPLLCARRAATRRPRPPAQAGAGVLQPVTPGQEERVRAWYLQFDADVRSPIGYLVAGAVAAVDGAPPCECCDEPTNLIAELELGQVVPDLPRGVWLDVFQCRNVGEGGDPNVVLVASETAHAPQGRPIVVGASAADDPDTDAGVDADDELFVRLMQPKVLGLPVSRADEAFIPECAQCGAKMRQLLLLDEDPAELNFGGYNLLVFACPAHGYGSMQAELM